MATKPKAHATPDDDFMAMPDVPEAPAELATGNAETEEADVLQGSLHGTRDDEETQKLTPPTGDWVKDNRWDYKVSRIAGDSQSEDFSSVGRTMISFMGRCTPRAAHGLEYNPVFFLRISPDRRYKESDPDKVDTAYKLYLRAREIHVGLYNEGVKEPDGLKKLVSMLETEEYVIRTMNGDNGPVVVDVKVKRQPK